MGLFIPNIKIPEKCSKCRDSGLKFTIDELGLKCPERKEVFGPTEADIKGIRRPDCPLVFVPPHGRLIDADALLEDIRENSVSYFADDFAHKWVDVAPTIIPAEEGET